MVICHTLKISDSNVVEKVEVFSQEDVDVNGGDYSSSVVNIGIILQRWWYMETMFLQQKSRGTFPGVGFYGNQQKKNFIAPKPSSKSSWTLKETGNELTLVVNLLIFLIQKIVNWSDNSDWVLQL